MALVPNRLPFPLSLRLSGTAAEILSREGREYDIAVGGIPFLLATTNDLPRTVETIPLRKEQFDAEADPGEQSLTGWWRRSQDSFHEGAGALYAESRLSTNPGNSFEDSEGVEVFTKNQVALLREMQSMDPATGFSRLGTSATTTGATVSAVGAGKFWTSPDKATTFTSLHAPVGKTIVDGFLSGDSFYDVADDGTLYEGTVASPGTATSWPCGAAVSRITFGKARLWAIGGASIWQPDLSLAGGSAQNAIFTHPNAGWNYTCIAEGPGAMYFGGHDGRSSAIQSIALADDGSVPTLSGAKVTAILPDDEFVQELAVLAGQFIGIGTSKGFRVGVIDSSNSISYGPLLITPDGVLNCTALTTLDRFFLVAFETTAGNAVAYKVDTGTVISDGVFPYAKNVQVGTTAGTLTSLATLGDDVLACDTTGAVYAQATSTLVASGWIQTGRIRFRTNEPKLFKYLDLETEPLDGQIAVSGLNEVGSLFDIGTLGADTTPRFGLTTALGPQKQVALKFTLARDSGDSTLGPVFNSFLLRAVPSVAPQRLHTLPLLCYDKEQAKSGQRYGYEGYASERLAALQELEDAGDSVAFQDFTRNGVGETVVIDGIRFVQTNANGFGGILVLQLRTVTI